jgi:hypothetical protein
VIPQGVEQRVSKVVSDGREVVGLFDGSRVRRITGVDDQPRLVIRARELVERRNGRRVDRVLKRLLIAVAFERIDDGVERPAHVVIEQLDGRLANVDVAHQADPKHQGSGAGGRIIDPDRSGLSGSIDGPQAGPRRHHRLRWRAGEQIVRIRLASLDVQRGDLDVPMIAAEVGVRLLPKCLPTVFAGVPANV